MKLGMMTGKRLLEISASFRVFTVGGTVARIVSVRTIRILCKANRISTYAICMYGCVQNYTKHFNKTYPEAFSLFICLYFMWLLPLVLSHKVLLFCDVAVHQQCGASSNPHQIHIVPNGSRNIVVILVCHSRR